MGLFWLCRNKCSLMHNTSKTRRPSLHILPLLLISNTANLALPLPLPACLSMQMGS
jgi:hypothetical protein